MSDAFQNLMTSLRKKYDFVVVDSPPILPFADTRFLAVLCDGAVLVARARITDRKSFEQASELLAQLSVPVLGVALNGVPSKEYPYRGYYAAVEAK
jgi:Mrp family chromosome partitioning ATPase